MIMIIKITLTGIEGVGKLVRRAQTLVVLLLLSMVLVFPVQAWAQSLAEENMMKAETIVDQALIEAKKGDLTKAKELYQQFNETWREIEESVKAESGKAYKEIESHMGKVVYALSRNKQDEVIKALEGLQATNEQFVQGKYPKGEKLKQENVSLADFIGYLQETKEKAKSKSQAEALDGINKLTDLWLSVEGVVVAQSNQVYNDSERDLVTIQAMLASTPPNYDGAIQTIDRMISYLTPLASKSGYSVWDAAMIILREGLEALLVVTALLAFVNKSKVNKGKGWIWSGVSVGLLISVVIAIVVKFVFASGAFGSNNALIAGWTGVITSVMLLYVSYWLHRQSHISEWQQFIRSKSETALHTGKLISLGFISFLAVFREGTETVLFFIGMVNQISIQDLLLGLLIGFGILAVIAYLIIIIGVKLPVRPFFMVSSVIVFYLCLKFTGMGIHSLQLAGLLPTTMVSEIPSIDFLALYPSLESIIPQIALVIIALSVVIWKRIAHKTQKQEMA
jgi:high-affinity iron transporter